MDQGALRSTVVFANPAARGGRAANLWRDLLASLPQLEAARVIFASDEAESRRQLRTALEPSDGEAAVRRLLSFGGDGTLHLVANELLQAGRARDVALGLIPAGTGSDLARYLGLPQRPLEALQQALQAAPRAIDVLRVTVVQSAGVERVEYAINTASAGLSGLVCSAVNAQARRGPDVFLRATLGALRHYRPLPCEIALVGAEPIGPAGQEGDDHAWFDGDLLVLAMANGRYFGNGMKIAPSAELDDGLMDVVLVPAIARWKLPLYLPRLYLGTHLGIPAVRFTRARKVSLRPRTPFPPLEVDGEALPMTRAEIEVVPKALSLLA